jgi:hypothetical protein
VIYNDLGNAVEKIMALTKNRGVDVAVEPIGFPSRFDICQETVTAAEYYIETRLVDTVTTPMLLMTENSYPVKDLLSMTTPEDNLKNKFSIFNFKLFYYLRQLVTNEYPDSKSEVKKEKL